MTIHHAVLKKAEANGVVLQEIDDNDRTHIVATGTDPEFSFSQEKSAKEVLANAIVWQMILAEHPYFTPIHEEGLFTVMQKGEIIGNGDDMTEAFTEAMDNYDDTDAAIDDFGEEEEEKDHSHSFAALARAKEIYRQRGNVNHCGDWIATTLEGQFLVVDDGKEVFDYDKFTQMLDDNGVEMTGKWADLPDSGSKGWQGRYRMNGRQRLELRIVETGFLMLKGETIKPSRAILKELRAKHKVEGK